MRSERTRDVIMSEGQFSKTMREQAPAFVETFQKEAARVAAEFFKERLRIEQTVSIWERPYINLPADLMALLDCGESTAWAVMARPDFPHDKVRQLGARKFLPTPDFRGFIDNLPLADPPEVRRERRRRQVEASDTA